MSEKIVLSKATEFELRGGVCVKVYPASLETLALMNPKLKKLDKMEKNAELDKQIDLFVDVVYDFLKEDNDIKKESLKKALTIEACLKIIQTSMGSVSSLTE